MSPSRPVPHFLQLLFFAKTWSPQLGQLQSPSRISWLLLAPVSIGIAPPPSVLGPPHFLHCLFFANCKSPQASQSQSPSFICWPLLVARAPKPEDAKPPSPPSPGFGWPHLLHSAFLANCISEQPGQFQSPGRMTFDIVAQL